jgi:zinc and cadmium transporter
VGVGLTIWLAAAAHEVPQELGDFGVLIHSGWSRRRAMVFNLLSSLTFLLGGVAAWAVASRFDTSWLLGFAAGNFLYIGASDLVPEVNRHRDLGMSALHFLAFAAGAGLLIALKAAFGG